MFGAGQEESGEWVAGEVVEEEVRREGWADGRWVPVRQSPQSVSAWGVQWRAARPTCFSHDGRWPRFLFVLLSSFCHTDPHASFAKQCEAVEARQWCSRLLVFFVLT